MCQNSADDPTSGNLRHVSFASPETTVLLGRPLVDYWVYVARRSGAVTRRKMGVPGCVAGMVGKIFRMFLRPPTKKNTSSHPEVRKKHTQKKRRLEASREEKMPLGRCQGAEKENCCSWLPCICCLIQTGHPQPSCDSGPSVLCVTLPGPSGVPSDAQAGWHQGQSANP